jgi:Ca-activated chloride channel family protein
MRFFHPHVLFLELLVPLLALFYFYVFRKKKQALASFGDGALVQLLSSASVHRQALKCVLVMASLFFIVLALARPQFGTRLIEVQQKGADVVIAVDVSSSMTAEDIKPNRLDRAKTLLSGLVQGLSGNRVGIIAFAGTSFWQCPLTLDIASATMFLEIMDSNLIPLPGTVIGDAIRLAAKGLEKTAPKAKAIVLLTDGEDHKSDPLGAAREAARQGIKIYCIGFGTVQGEPIPVRDGQGNLQGYKKDAKGQTVMSKMDETLLSTIATETGGEYFRADNGQADISRIIDGIQGLDQRRLSSRQNRQYEDRYGWFLLLGVLCLFAELAIPETSRRQEDSRQ